MTMLLLKAGFAHGIPHVVAAPEMTWLIHRMQYAAIFHG